jgi:hypothetical protein
VGGVVHQAAGNLSALRVQAGHHITTLELPAHRHHANRQERLSAAQEHVGRTSIQCQVAPELQMIGQPLLTG